MGHGGLASSRGVAGVAPASPCEGARMRVRAVRGRGRGCGGRCRRRGAIAAGPASTDAGVVVDARIVQERRLDEAVAAIAAGVATTRAVGLGELQGVEVERVRRGWCREGQKGRGDGGARQGPERRRHGRAVDAHGSSSPATCWRGSATGSGQRAT